MVGFVNNLKTVVLMGALSALMVAVGAVMGQQMILPFLGISILMNLGAWYFSDTIAIRAMHGREVSERTGGELYEMVDRLRRRAGLPMPRVYITPHRAPNAFATGRGPSSAAVAVTEGALQTLDRGELEGVIGHELAHIKNRDTLTSTVAATMSGVLATIAQFGLLFGGGGRDRGANPMVVMLTVIVGAVGAAVIRAAISRSREFVADRDGARIAGSAEGLMSALSKLDALNRRVPLAHANPAFNSLFIVEPMMGDAVSRIFASHPPVEARLRALAGRA